MTSIVRLVIFATQVYTFIFAGIPQELRELEEIGKQFDACFDYNELSSLDRLEDFFEPNMVKCDVELKRGWYRFTGDAGSRMAHKCMQTGDTACSALGAGWLVGSHPTVEEGVVSRGVCFRTRSSCCSSTINIKVKNCGQYMVYYLIAPDNCPYRYCSSKYQEIRKEPQSAKPTTVTETKSKIQPVEPSVATTENTSIPETVVEVNEKPKINIKLLIPTKGPRPVNSTGKRNPILVEILKPTKQPVVVTDQPEPVEPSEQPEPVEPTEQPEPVEPTEQPEPVEPTEQPEPVEPTEQPEPVEPTEQPEPVEPVEPNERPEPVEPVEPNERPEPVEPVEPNERPEPVEPVEPNERPEPVEPVEPNERPEPVEPIEPTEQLQPGEPVDPENVEQITAPYSVECFSKHMVIKIKMARYVRNYHLEEGFLHLNDPECRVYHKGESDAILETPLDGCETERRVTRDGIVFRNKVFGISFDEEYNKKRLYLSQELINFNCTYNST